MKNLTIFAIIITFIFGLVGNQPVRAQYIPENPLTRLDNLARYGKNLKLRIGKNTDHLSSGGQFIINFSDNWDNFKQSFEEAVKRNKLAPVPGNNKNASEDSVYSRLSGNTQSETSVAWYGSNAVCGFNDSGSLLRTALGPSPSPSGSLSFNGYSRSTNKGATFTDKGVIIPDPLTKLPQNVKFRDLQGDPIVKCKSSSIFYYASIANDSDKNGNPLFSGISVLKSTDGGNTFGGAIMASSKDANTHFLDKEWMGVDPSNNNVYISYTDFDSEVAAGRTAIEFVRSTDGGATWSSPLVIDEVLGDGNSNTDDPFVQDSIIAVGANGEIYVAWETLSADRVTRSIRIRKSTNGGVSFSPSKTIANVTYVGTGLAIQGLIRPGYEIQGLAVDNSNTSTKGNVYCTWHDGRNANQNDIYGIEGKYCFGDILFSKSTDGGTTWSAPKKVNTDSGKKIDQFQPALAVDSTGKIGVLFYDRRKDSRNFLNDIYYAESSDAGVSWTNKRITTKGFASIHFIDMVIAFTYMGDYISIASDASMATQGFIGAWGENSRGDANIGADQIAQP